MEVDNDVEGQLLQQFSSMGTTDKDVLIKEFQRLIGNDLNPAMCSFFLDMNNWNLPAAIGSYYDNEQPSNIRVPTMSFIKDITIGEGESVPTNTDFVKTWRIQNTGSDSWPPGCCLRFVGGEQFGACERVMVSSLQPSALSDVSIPMRSPPTTGIFQGQWRMQSSTGLYFGEIIWVILQVEEHGLLGLTQQLSNISSGNQPPSQVTESFQNPFGSPNKTNNAPIPNPFASPSQHLTGSPSQCVENGSEIISSECRTTENGCMESQTCLGFDSRLQGCVTDGSMCDSGRTVSGAVLVPGDGTLLGATEHMLPNSWPGTPSLLTHEMSTAAPTPHVSPHAGAPAITSVTSPTLDLLEDMT